MRKATGRVSGFFWQPWKIMGMGDYWIHDGKLIHAMENSIGFHTVYDSRFYRPEWVLNETMKNEMI
jgi:hypothetical protein